MESFEIKNQIESKDILDPNQMYFDFIDKQDQSNWEYEESLGVYLVPEEVIAEFIQEYLRINNFRHLDIYEYCQRHPMYFSSMLKDYYRDFIEEREMPDIIKKAFQLTPDGVSTIFHEFIESYRLKEEERKHSEQILQQAKTVQEKGGFLIGGLEVMPKDRLIKFPEYLIEETGGVEGYLRRELTWEDLEQLYNGLFSKDELKKWIDILWKISDYKSYAEKNEEKYRTFEKVDSLKSFETLCEILVDLNGYFSKKHFMYGKILDLKNYLSDAEFERFKNIIPKAANIYRTLLDILGDNFISRENIHVMNGTWGLSGEKVKGDFSRKMITQKIFDPNDNSVRADSEGNGTAVHYYIRSILNPMEYEYIEASNINPDSLHYKKDGMSKKESFLIPHGGGLSVSNGGIWSPDGRDDSRLGVAKPIFGFGFGNEAYVKYLKSYKKLLEDSGLKNKNEYAKHYMCINDLIQSGISSVYAPFGDSAHPMIPVVIGHPDIPDLRWCHANHAYIPTKNGINVLKMISSKEKMTEEENRLKDKIRVGKEE